MAKNSILILGLGRSGTSSLAKGLTTQIGEYVNEPWRDNHTNKNYVENSSSFFLNYINETSNIVLKSLIGHIPYDYHVSTRMAFYKYLISVFGIENTILITRKNFDEHVDSRMHLRYKVKIANRYRPLVEDGKTYLNKHSVHNTYRPSDIPQSFLQNKEERQDVIDRTIQQRKEIFELSNLFKKDIVWYEDLYGSDRSKSLKIIKSWEFKDLKINCEELNKYLHPKYKYNKENLRSLL